MAGPWEDFAGNTPVAVSPTPAPQNGPWTDFAQTSKPWEDFGSPPPSPSTTPAADQAAAEPSLISRALTLAHTPSPQWLQPAEARARAFVEGAGVPGSLKEVKDFVTRSPIQDVKDIYNDVTQIPGRVANIGQTLSGSPAATVARAPLSPEAFGVYGTAAGMLIPAAHEAFKGPIETAGTVPAPTEAPPVVGNEQFARVAPVNEGAGAAVPADNPAPAQSTILEPTTQPEPKPVVPKFDPVIRAAVKDDDGNIYTGTTHGEAISKVPPDINIADQNAEGFVTQSGQFLTGSEAYQKAVDQGQIEGPAGKALDASLLNIANRKRTPITEQNAAQAATDIGGLKYGGVQSWPADSGIPSTLEFTITEPGKETTLSVPPGITPEELTARRDAKLAEYEGQPASGVADRTQSAAQPQSETAPTPTNGDTLAGNNGTSRELNQAENAPDISQQTEPMQAVQQTQEAPVTDAEPHVSAIANRFTQERAARGEIGTVVPGQGASTADLVQRGLQMPPERAAEAVSRVMQGAGTSIDDAAAIRGEEARLSQRSNQLSKIAQTNPKDLNAQVAADNAFKDLTDFHNGPVARLKNDWHARGMAMQGEIPVDLSTLNGLREKWLKDTGEAPPASIEPTLKRAAERVSKTVAEEKGAMQQLSNGIDKATKSRKFPTADEVRANIRERLGLGPCEV